MAIYENYVLPHLLNLVMKAPALTKQRAKLIPEAEGRVLEIGIGSGLNLPFYSDRVSHLWGLDPSAQMRRYAEKRAVGKPFPVEFIGLTGEAIPLDDHSADTVVTTWTLCTIPDAGKALREMRRVLKPGGRLLFVEHGKAPDAAVVKWQERLNGLQKTIAGGCHLNREPDKLIEGAGFRIEEMKTRYIDGPKAMTFTYRGSARPG
ncbi:class I SAM-dependent methyltransferase [Zavarzinia sp. CC-PAN008]|uniref:class I SAM-dependent methyltransferase n=1 Tax=Zavarzinia sp. CC-PAN008 TaxID=3243332 RepID=UPI003F742FBA